MFNALTIDLEDWYQGIEIPQNRWDGFESRIEKSTQKLLGILKEKETKATFFVSGYLAKNNPNLIKEIKKNGHEIASHGFDHQFVYKQNNKEFEKDLLKSLNILEKIINQKIIGYRAPYFSITKKSLWALDTLKKFGLLYDSSIYPIKNYRYGIPEAPTYPYQIRENFWEFPISFGGAYFRIFPYQIIKLKIKNKTVFYLHPWELDPDQPRINLPLRIFLPHYFNLKSTDEKLKRLLSEFKWTNLKNLLKEVE